MALPRGATGSLRPSFLSARAVALAVRRACAFALSQPMSDRPEPTVARLRYPLGGDRPSQTPRHAGSRPPLQGARLDARDPKGGISRTAPPELAPGLHSLPPILHMRTLAPLQSWSKGARGLSV